MTREEAWKEAFWKFPVLDVLAALIITVISVVLSIYDKTAAFGIPGLVGVWGFYSFYKGLTSGNATRFLYGVRVIIICISATFLLLTLFGDYLTAVFILICGALAYLGVIFARRIVEKETERK